MQFYYVQQIKTKMERWPGGAVFNSLHFRHRWQPFGLRGSLDIIPVQHKQQNTIYYYIYSSGYPHLAGHGSGGQYPVWTVPLF